MLIQVSNTGTLIKVSDVSPNGNGKLQLSQPVGVGYVGGSIVAVQTAKNPVRVPPSSDLNVTVSVLVLVIMVHGSDVCPQCLVKRLSKFRFKDS